MRRGLLGPAAAALLVGPTALAFFSGGYFTQPRLWASLVAWLAVLVLTIAGPAPIPASVAGRLALAGLAGITLWTGLSILWAPLADPATQSLERLILYCGVFIAAYGLARDRRVARAVEPAFALGAAVTITYGLAGRLLPRTITEHPSVGAGDRLDQPITYWNAEGALAAMGLVLCARIVGDPGRRDSVRCLAAAACVPLGGGIYLSYSRGALVAAVVGLVVLLAAAPSRVQLRGVAVALGAAAPAALGAAIFPSVATLHGTLADRQGDGRVVLLLLLVLGAGAATLTHRLVRREPDDPRRDARLGFAARLPVVAIALVVLTTAGLVAGGIGERNGRSTVIQRNGAERLVSVSSRRYDYWRIGLDAYGDHPLRGTGAGGFRVAWLEHRPVNEGVLEIHSVELEMLVELGLVGALAFVLFLAGAGRAASTALRRHPYSAAGPVAACAVWLLHSAIDWDWQIPAVTLPALVLAATILALSERAMRRSPPPARPERVTGGAPAATVAG